MDTKHTYEYTAAVVTAATFGIFTSLSQNVILSLYLYFYGGTFAVLRLLQIQFRACVEMRFEKAGNQRHNQMIMAKKTKSWRPTQDKHNQPKNGLSCNGVCKLQ